MYTDPQMRLQAVGVSVSPRTSKLMRPHCASGEGNGLSTTPVLDVHIRAALTAPFRPIYTPRREQGPVLSAHTFGMPMPGHA